VATDLDERALQGLLPLVARWTGFHPDAIRPDALRRVARSLAGVDGAEKLLARAADHDPPVVAALTEGITVGETYFFRQPEHFAHLSRMILEGQLAFRARTVRAWSAGCATGEEAYSLAATLAVAGFADVEVIGTDILARNVRAAERGEYGSWSIREHCPVLHPITELPGARPEPGETVRVSSWLRRHTTFQVANILDAQPAFAGRFDVILCRNVLIYFSPDSARAALANVAAALAPGGVLYLGPMDASALPPELVEIGPAGLNVYAHSSSRAEARLSPPPPPRTSAPSTGERTAQAPPVPPPTVTISEPIALHLRALTLLDGGDRLGAEALLEQLRSRAPEYLPGKLELALMRDRAGRRTEAANLMREILAVTASLPPEQVVPGPEDLSVGYLQASAGAYLGPERGRT
jgi:chemotaxis protein methyltransferase CheR